MSDLTIEDFPYYALINWKRFFMIEVGKTHIELEDRYIERYGDDPCEHMIDARISESDYQSFLKEGQFAYLSCYWSNGKVHYYNEV